MDMKKKYRNTAVVFGGMLIVILAIFAAALIKTDAYNRARHSKLCCRLF